MKECNLVEIASLTVISLLPMYFLYTSVHRHLYWVSNAECTHNKKSHLKILWNIVVFPHSSWTCSFFPVLIKSVLKKINQTLLCFIGNMNFLNHFRPIKRHKLDIVCENFFRIGEILHWNKYYIFCILFYWYFTHNNVICPRDVHKVYAIRRIGILAAKIIIHKQKH